MTNARKNAKSPHETKTRRPKISPLSAPEELSVRDWQIALRHEFGRAQTFHMKNLGKDSVLSDFRITNPASGGQYIVTIRGLSPGSNLCTCPDFTTNTLGTCKHIEFTLAQLEKRRGAHQRLQAGAVLEHSEIQLEYGPHRNIKLCMGQTASPTFKRLARAYFDEQDQWQLAPAKIAEFDEFLRKAQKGGHLVQVRDDAAQWLTQQRDALHREATLKHLFPQGAKSKALQTLLKTRFYPYQAEGVLFATQHGRCLIGDEMGLGKTIQAIGAATLLSRHFGAERILVVCPTSLKHQWEKELIRFADLNATTIQGARHIREEQFRHGENCKIINYELLHRDIDLIQKWSPDILIIDEAQRVKNWNTLAAKALRRIDTPYAFVLTGTPLENKLEELLALVQLIDRHRLGALWQIREQHQIKDEKGRVTGYRALDQIAQALAPIMIRRRKAEVLTQLPERIEQTLFVPMTARQQQYHQENRDIVATIVARWQRMKYLTEADQRRLTAALQNMRMACDSSYLLDRSTRDGAKLTELMTLLEEVLATPDAKVVVFSQWVRMHELIADALEAKDYGYVLFHGGIPSHKRGALTDQFRENPSCRVFLSTDAGAAGLNLQNAATVINIDLPWNPAVLAQRIARVHRLGQKNAVQVINLVAQGTLEEGMLSLLSFKKSLADGILDGGNTEVFLKGSRLTQFMESVTTATDSMATSGAPLAAETSDEPSPMVSVASPSSDTNTVIPVATDATVASGDSDSTPATSPHATNITQSLTGLLRVGLQLMEQLSHTTNTQATPSWIEQDPVTGQRYLKMALPEPTLIDQAAETLRKLLTPPPGGTP